jgi:hypothetical protein
VLVSRFSHVHDSRVPEASEIIGHNRSWGGETRQVGIAGAPGSLPTGMFRIREPLSTWKGTMVRDCHAGLYANPASKQEKIRWPTPSLANAQAVWSDTKNSGLGFHICRKHITGVRSNIRRLHLIFRCHHKNVTITFLRVICWQWAARCAPGHRTRPARRPGQR